MKNKKLIYIGGAAVVAVVLLVFTVMRMGGSSSEIDVWVNVAETSPEAAVYQDSIDRYNSENPDQPQASITYIPTESSGGGYDDKLSAAVASGDMPDVLLVDQPLVASYAEAGILTPITEYVPQEVKDSYYESTYSSGVYNEELYALGQMEASVMLYYNADYVDASTMSTDPTNPNTWTDIKNACDAAEANVPADKQENWACIDMGISPGEFSSFLYEPLVWGANGEIIGEDGKTVEGVLNSDQNKETLTKFQNLVNEGYIAVQTDGDMGSKFKSGESAFWISGQWEWNSIVEDAPDVNLGVTYYPVSENWDGTPYAPCGSYKFGVSTASDYPAESAEVVMYLTDTTAQVGMYNAIFTMPTSQAATDIITAENPDSVNPAYKVAVDQLNITAHPRNTTPNYAEASLEYSTALETIYKTGADVSDTLDQAAELATANIANKE